MGDIFGFTQMSNKNKLQNLHIPVVIVHDTVVRTYLTILMLKTRLTLQTTNSLFVDYYRHGDITIWLREATAYKI